ncbi:hypothetical protein HDV05_000010 [Chytridiales sp. JEL 0842]|nr:hypothetical protein HDV05_000010 [Chytridiales sp. JEL 0842]
MSEASFTKLVLPRLAMVDVDEMIRYTFLAFDLGCNGFITLQDVVSVFAQVAPSVPTHVVEEYFNEIDGNQDGKLPFIVGWQDLKDLFREAGNVLRADVAQSPAGKSRGFGTILFGTAEEATEAINKFNNYEWHGRRIEVREDRAVSGSIGGHPGAPPPDANAPTGQVPFPGSGDASAVNNRALYVGNLPFSVGWQDLKDLFRNAGTVQRADIPGDAQRRSKGFGTVVMASVEEARKAVSMYNGFEWNGRRIEVREDRNYVEGAGPVSRGNFNSSPSSSLYHNSPFPSVANHISPSVSASGPLAGRQLFVGNLPFTVQWQELKDLFRTVGTVQRADVAVDNSGRSRGYGQVVMSTVEEAQSAIAKLNGTELQGRSIEVREDKYAAEGGAGSVGTQVFVGNLPFSARWQELKDLFRPHGLNPLHADIMTEHGTGRSKGCGVVRFSTRDEAERAVQLVNGTMVAGRAVIVHLDKFA